MGAPAALGDRRPRPTHKLDQKSSVRRPHSVKLPSWRLSRKLTVFAHHISDHRRACPDKLAEAVAGVAILDAPGCGSSTRPRPSPCRRAHGGRKRISQYHGASEIAAQVGGFSLCSPFHVEWRDEMAVPVHEIDDGGVVHGVVAAFERNLLGIDPIRLERGVDRCGIASQGAQLCVIRRKAASDSDSIRPPIATEVGHPFRSKPATPLRPA